MIGQLYPWIKSIHLIFVIAWMAGMLMYPRLKIYQMQSAPGEKQFASMQAASDRLRRIIMTPSILIVWVLGFVLLWMTEWVYAGQGWFLVKFALVILMSAFHGIFISYGKKIDAGLQPISEKRLRMINEVPFIAMIIVVIMVIVKPF